MWFLKNFCKVKYFARNNPLVEVDIFIRLVDFNICGLVCKIMLIFFAVILRINE